MKYTLPVNEVGVNHVLTFPLVIYSDEQNKNY